MALFIDTSEVRALAVDLSKAPAGVGVRISRVVRKTALDIEADAKILVPVDTGNLKNSIGSKVKPLSAVISATTDYASYVEEGTSRMAAQPYMRPAFDRREPGFREALGQIAGDIL